MKLFKIIFLKFHFHFFHFLTKFRICRQKYEKHGSMDRSFQICTPFFATNIFPQVPMRLAVIVIVRTNELSMTNITINIFPEIPMQLAVIVIVFERANELSMKKFKVEPALNIDGPESAIWNWWWRLRLTIDDDHDDNCEAELARRANREIKSIFSARIFSPFHFYSLYFHSAPPRYFTWLFPCIFTRPHPEFFTQPLPNIFTRLLLDIFTWQRLGICTGASKEIFTQPLRGIFTWPWGL